MLNEVTFYDVKEMIMLKFIELFKHKFLRKIYKTFENFSKRPIAKDVGGKRNFSAVESLQLNAFRQFRPNKACISLHNVLLPKGLAQVAAAGLTVSIRKNWIERKCDLSTQRVP